MDVHQFDGRLDNHINTYDLREVVPFDEKYRAVSSHHNWQTIINQWGLPANHDQSSNIRAEPLVAICYQLSQLPEYESDFNQLLESQLTEMDTGMCPPGRTTRLYQIIVAFSTRIN